MFRGARSWARRAALVGALLSCAFDWPQRTARILAELEAERDPVTRADLVRLLSYRPDDEAEAALVALLEDPTPPLRRVAAQALAKRHGEAAEAALLRALTDADASVRSAAAEGLGRLGSRGAVSALLRALGDANSETRAAALGALARVLSRAAGTNADRAALTPIAVALDDEAPEVRVAALRALAALAQEEALGALLAKLHDPAPELRASALSLLGKLQPDGAERTLRPLLEDFSELVQLEALRVLSTLPRPHDDETVQRLRALQARARPHVAGAASRLLVAPKSPSEPAWISLLARTEHVETASAESLLTQLERALPAGEELAVDPLVRWLARAPAALRGRIASLIARARPTRCNPLIALLDDPDAQVRRFIAQASAQCKTPEIARGLFRALHDEHARVAVSAATALGQLCSEGVLTELVTAPRAEAQDRVGAALRTRALVGCLARVPSGALDEGARRKLEQRLLAQLDGQDLELASLAARALASFPSPGVFARLARRYTDAPLPLRIAILRATVRDRSPQARSLRAEAIAARKPALSITARVAAWLARDPAPATARPLAHEGRDLPWPVGPVEAFLLASSLQNEGGAAPGSPQIQALCRALTAPEPVTRENALAGFARWKPAPAGAAAIPCLSSTLNSPPRAAPSLVPAGPDAAFERPSVPGSFHALTFADGRVLVSVADGAGAVGWPELPHIASENPWQQPYGTE